MSDRPTRSVRAISLPGRTRMATPFSCANWFSRSTAGRMRRSSHLPAWGVATIVLMPSATASRSIASESAGDSAPSSTPGSTWLWRSTSAMPRQPPIAGARGGSLSGAATGVSGIVAGAAGVTRCTTGGRGETRLVPRCFSIRPGGHQARSAVIQCPSIWSPSWQNARSYWYNPTRSVDYFRAFEGEP